MQNDLPVNNDSKLYCPICAKLQSWDLEVYYILRKARKPVKELREGAKILTDLFQVWGDMLKICKKT